MITRYAQVERSFDRCHSSDVTGYRVRLSHNNQIIIAKTSEIVANKICDTINEAFDAGRQIIGKPRAKLETQRLYVE